MFGRGRAITLQAVQVDDLIPDNRLLPDEADLLGHEAIAKAIAEIALTARTPVNIALFGAWGFGKSNIYSMVESHVAAIASNDVKLAAVSAPGSGSVDAGELVGFEPRAVQVSTSSRLTTLLAYSEIKPASRLPVAATRSASPTTGTPLG
jgi:hypothetical protein